MMKTSLKLSVVVGLATALISLGATAAEKTFNVGGWAEYDITTGKTTFTNGDAVGSRVIGTGSVKNTNEGGRVQLTAKARIDNDNGSFVEAVAAPRFYFTDGKQSDASGDQYIMFGKKAWDIKLGRFEAIDLFPYGKQAGRDTDVALQRASDVKVSSDLKLAKTDNDATTNDASGGLGYQANKMRGRNSDDVIQGAAHFNIGKTQVELGAGYKDANGTKTTGIRPVVKFDAGRFRVAAGYDSYKTKTPTTTTQNFQGFGVTAGTTIGTVSANFNIAQGKDKALANAPKMTSYGLNGSRGRFGAGYIYDKTANVGKQDTFYGAYTVPLMGSKDASVTFAANTSKAKYTGGDTVKNNLLRARFNYNF
ncbi:MAG: hypothetical protein RLZZ422_171 [Pseudomonadota bacterium]|jgi:hypothetical protein